MKSVIICQTPWSGKVTHCFVFQLPRTIEMASATMPSCSTNVIFRIAASLSTGTRKMGGISRHRTAIIIRKKETTSPFPEPGPSFAVHLVLRSPLIPGRSSSSSKCAPGGGGFCIVHRSKVTQKYNRSAPKARDCVNRPKRKKEI